MVLPMPLRPSRPSEAPAGTRARRRAGCGCRRSRCAGLQLSRALSIGRLGPPRPSLAVPGAACGMLLAQVGVAHLGIDADPLRHVARDDRAVDHHRDAVGDAEHRVHVVLDQQHGMLGLERRQQRQHALGLLGAHAGERLVEQQHARARSPGTSRSRAGACRRGSGCRRCAPPASARPAASSASRAAAAWLRAQWRAPARTPRAAASRACAARRQFSSTLNSRKMVVRW